MSRELIVEMKENVFTEIRPGQIFVVDTISLKVTTEGKICKHSVPVTTITLNERPGCIVIDPKTTYFTKYVEPVQSTPTASKKRGEKCVK
jgi:hypothetical protein